VEAATAEAIQWRFGVATRRWILCFLPLALMSVLAGCGGGSTTDVHNQPPPPVNKVSIAFQPAPAGSVQLGVPVSLTAVVSNDTSSAGVDWSVTCPGGKCGSFSSLHTASGQATIFTPPSIFSANSFVLTVEAFATADHTRNVTASMTITAFGNSLQGTFILQAQGADSTLFQPYQFAGAVMLDGSGGITSGEQTVNVADPNLGVLVTKSASIIDGSYFLGPDGRGTITINTNDQSIGVNGTEIFSFVYLSRSQALITQTDSTVSASGSMDLQTNVAALSGGYAFVANGMDMANLVPTAFGGVFNVDSPNTISGAGSISDQNLNGTLTQNQTLSGTVSSADPFGAVTIDLNLAFASGPVQFVGYIVDARHMKLIESDNASGAGTSSTGGIAIAQGAATGTFNSLGLFSGSYVFGVTGEDVDFSSASLGIPSTLTSVGVFTSDGAGNLTSGFTDTYLQGNCVQKSCTQNGITGGQISAAFTGHYTMVLNGIGRVRITPSTFSPSPAPGFHPLYIFYLTGTGNEALVLDGGDLNSTQNYASVGAGIAYPQSSAPFTFAGKYGFSLTQQNGSEMDITGQWTADPSTSSLSGFMDSLTSPNATLTGTFAAPGSDGRFTAGLGGQGFEFTSPSTSAFAAEFYEIDSTRGFFVETDLIDPNGPSGVVSLGYYAARIPVCSGCP
jgi:hypothetical protein